MGTKLDPSILERKGIAAVNFQTILSVQRYAVIRIIMPNIMRYQAKTVKS